MNVDVKFLFVLKIKEIVIMWMVYDLFSDISIKYYIVKNIWKKSVNWVILNFDIGSLLCWCNFGEWLFSIFLVKMMVIIFYFNGSGGLGREIKFFKGVSDG